MEKWLKDSILDERTRSLEAMSKLQRLYQREDQSYRNFADMFEDIECELSYELPAMFRVSLMLIALHPELKQQIVRTGIPDSRQELDEFAMRAEAVLEILNDSSVVQSNGTSSRGRRWNELRGGRWPANLNSGSPALVQPALIPRKDSAADQSGTHQERDVTCYNCGGHGHVAKNCPTVTCYNCGQLGHISPNCHHRKGGTTMRRTHRARVRYGRIRKH